MDRETDGWMDGETNGQIERKTDREMYTVGCRDRKMDRWTERQMDMDREIDGQKGTWTKDRWTERQTDK